MQKLSKMKIQVFLLCFFLFSVEYLVLPEISEWKEKYHSFLCKLYPQIKVEAVLLFFYLLTVQFTFVLFKLLLFKAETR